MVWWRFSDYTSQAEAAGNFFWLKFSAVSVFFLRTRLEVGFEKKPINLRHRLPVGRLVLDYHSILISDRPSASARKKVKFSGNRPPVRGY